MAVLALAHTPVHASDFTPLALMVLGVFAFVFVIVFAVVWFLTRWVSWPWLRVLLRAMAIALFWTPMQMDGAGYWWPACMSWGNLAALPHKGVALASVGVAIAALWLVGVAFARASSDLAGTMRDASVTGTKRSRSDLPATRDTAP
jgi:hypothetical protein